MDWFAVAEFYSDWQQPWKFQSNALIDTQDYHVAMEMWIFPANYSWVSQPQNLSTLNILQYMVFGTLFI